MSELEQKPSPPHTRTATDAPKEGASGASDLGTAEVGHLLPSQWNHLANCLLHTCPHQPREDRDPPPPAPELSTGTAWSTAPGPEEALSK